MINCSHYAGSISGCRKQITSKAAHQRLLCVRTAGPHGTKLASGGDRTQPVRSCGNPEHPHPRCTAIGTRSSSRRPGGSWSQTDTFSLNLRKGLISFSSKGTLSTRLPVTLLPRIAKHQGNFKA